MKEDAALPAGALRTRACAKVNLTLQVLGRRADGYHELESLVAFADCADTLTLFPAASPCWTSRCWTACPNPALPGRTTLS